MVLACAFFLHACNNNTSENTNPPKNSPANEKKLTPEERAQEIRNSREENYDRSNPLAYALSEPYCTVMGGMVKKSKWGKQLSTENWILLLPSDELLKEMSKKIVQKMRLPENIDLLNTFVGDHIIITPINIDKPEDAEELETVTGKKLKLQSGAQNIGGANYRKNQVILKKGGIIYLSSMMTEYRQ